MADCPRYLKQPTPYTIPILEKQEHNLCRKLIVYCNGLRGL
jgi:hypothetical protein